MAIIKGPVNPVISGTTTFPDLKSVQVTAPNRHSVRPSLVLDFANSKTLDPRITFTRGSSATYYDGSTALAEQNLLIRSQDWSAAWGLNSSATTITANSTTAPDGTTTATQFSIARTTSELHYAEQSVASLSGPVTVSAYFKANTQNFLNLAVYQYGFTDAYSVAFNLSTGTITKTTTAGSVFNVSSSITSVGNSWYRVTVTASFPSVGNTYLILSSNSVSIPTYNYQNILESYSGTVGNSFYVWGAQMENRSSATAYTATTTAPAWNYIPVLQTAGVNQSRFEIDPFTKESKGLLIEEQRTNSALSSEDFTTWNLEDTTIIGNCNIAPNGTATADLVVPNTVYLDHTFYRSVTGSGTTTVSIYAKAGGINYIFIGRNNNAPSDGAFFDLVNGVVSQNTSGGTTTITPVGNGWYRCSLTTTFSSYVLFCTSTNGTSLIHTGNGYSGVYVWGAQWENGGFPTSYIGPTSGSAVTRSADVATMIGGTNFSSWFNQSEGTIFADVSSPVAVNSTSFGGILAITDSGYSNVVISMGVNGSTSLLQHEQYTAGNSRTTMQTYGVSNRIFKTIFGYDSVGASGFVTSGTLSVATALQPLAAVDRLKIGAERTGGAFINGYIKKIAYYPKRLSAVELQGSTIVN